MIAGTGAKIFKLPSRPYGGLSCAGGAGGGQRTRQQVQLVEQVEEDQQADRGSRDGLIDRPHSDSVDVDPLTRRSDGSGARVWSDTTTLRLCASHYSTPSSLLAADPIRPARSPPG